jgi:hypothetical protein
MTDPVFQRFSGDVGRPSKARSTPFDTVTHAADRLGFPKVISTCVKIEKWRRKGLEVHS